MTTQATTPLIDMKNISISFGGIRAVDDGIGHIARFSASGPGFANHAFQHLRCGDHRQAHPVALFDDLLLEHRHFFRTDLHAEIATGDHHSADFPQNLIEVLNGLRLLDLGDDRL